MKLQPQIELRDYLAASIMQGICAGDWKFDIKEETWDTVAARRAYELADKMLSERDAEKTTH